MATSVENKKGVKLLVEAADLLGWDIIVHTDVVGGSATDEDDVIGISVGETKFLDELGMILDNNMVSESDGETLN